MGNDLLVLGRGWVCDTCNNICSAFESEVSLKSILGLERCRLGVITKKGKAARAETEGISWFALPNAKENRVAAEADWGVIPVLWGKHYSSGRVPFLLHDDSCVNISRLLLKIGVEIASVGKLGGNLDLQRDFGQATSFVLGRCTNPWPYFVLRAESYKSHVISVFFTTPDSRDYLRSCGFDVYLHAVDKEAILFFEYGHFHSAISLTSRSTGWLEVLRTWGVPYVGCPLEFESLSSA